MRPYSSGGILGVSLGPEGWPTMGLTPRPSIHRLQPGIPGYLILISPLAFASERQEQARKLPSLLGFFPISAHSTATPGVPLPPPALERRSFGRPLPVEPGDFTPNLRCRLHALYAQYMRITLASYVLPRLLARSYPRLIPGVLSSLIPQKRGLRPEGCRPPRGVAASRLPALCKIPYCCLP